MKRSSAKNVCPLTNSPRKRAAANKQTAQIKESFPPGLSQPALRALAGAGYTRLDQFAKARAEDLVRLHGMGPKAIELIRAALKEHGKSLLK